MVYSIIQKNQLEGVSRLDAEYYQPEYLEAARTIKNHNYKRLGEIITILTDYHANGSYELLRNNVRLLSEPDFSLMVRAVDLERDNFDLDVRYVSKEAYEFLKKTKIFGREIIIDKIGNTGAVYLMPKLNSPVTLGMNLFLLRPKEGIDPEFIYIFLNSKFGKLLISQKITGTVPTSIDKDSVRSIVIPIVHKSFSDKIRKLVDGVFDLKEKSRTYFSQAENLLLEELGLRNFKIEDDLSYIINLSEIKSARRADAEYFQPKYEKLISKIKSKNVKPLTDVVEDVPARFNPNSKPDESFRYVELANINLSIGVIDGYSEVSGKEAPSRAKRLLKIGDVIVSSVEGSLEKVALVDSDYEGSLASTGFFQFRGKEILPEVLLVLAKSIVLQMQLEKWCAGTILTAVPQESLKNIIVPILPKPTQQKIADLVQKSHQARKKSKELLEEAKRKVEEMIEKGGGN